MEYVLLLMRCLAKHAVNPAAEIAFIYATSWWYTVNFIVLGHLHRFWDSGYLCHFSTEMAEIWCPGTSFQDDWTHKISALYLLYFQSYETFS